MGDRIRQAIVDLVLDQVGVEVGRLRSEEPDRGACEHGVRPWWDCDECRASSKYSWRMGS